MNRGSYVRSAVSRRAVVLALLACTGCAVRKPAFQTYRLVKHDTGPVLIPPGVASPDVAQRTFASDVAVGCTHCRSDAGAIGIQARKKRLRVTVRRDMLVKQPPGWLTAWTTEIEAQGCIGAGDGLKLADRIAESLPLDPNTAFRLRHASVQDIGPQVRVQVISPIVRDGAAPDAPSFETVEKSGNANSLTLVLKSTANLIGYETAWYAAQPKANGMGFTIAPLFAERHIQGETERRPQPATNYLQFPEDGAFYRLIYKAQQTEYTALVVGARTRAELEHRAEKLRTGAGSCEKLEGELCVAIPRIAGINLLLPVTVNGREIMVRWGATVGEAIRESGERQAQSLLPRLAVHKPYHGRPAPVEFDPSSNMILNLVLTGGELITWR